MKKRCFTLLGVKKVESSKLKVQSAKTLSFCLLILSLLLSTFNLQLATNQAQAAVTVTNTGGVDWTDGWNQKYTTAYDTAAILVLKEPTIIITKDVRNIRTGEMSADAVAALIGDTIEFILNTENSGDTDARDVVMLDSIPFSTIYDTGSALDTGSLDPVDPPDTVTFQHIAGGTFDETGTGTITAIKWQWDKIEGVSGYNKRVVKFRVRVQ